MSHDSTGKYRAPQCFKCRHLTACACPKHYVSAVKSPSTQYGPIKQQDALLAALEDVK